MVAPCSRGVFLAVCVSSYNSLCKNQVTSVDLDLVFAKSQRSELLCLVGKWVKIVILYCFSVKGTIGKVSR